MRRVTHERYISQSQRANCDLARRYVGLNLSQQGLDGGPFEKLFLDDARKYNWPKTGKVFVVYFGSPASQSIRRGRINREGALDVRESRERRDKIYAEKNRVQLAPLARRRAVPTTESEWVPAKSVRVTKRRSAVVPE